MPPQPTPQGPAPPAKTQKNNALEEVLEDVRHGIDALDAGPAEVGDPAVVLLEQRVGDAVDLLCIFIKGGGGVVGELRRVGVVRDDDFAFPSDSLTTRATHQMPAQPHAPPTPTSRRPRSRRRR